MASSPKPLYIRVPNHYYRFLHGDKKVRNWGKGTRVAIIVEGPLAGCYFSYSEQDQEGLDSSNSMLAVYIGQMGEPGLERADYE